MKVSTESRIRSKAVCGINTYARDSFGFERSYQAMYQYLYVDDREVDTLEAKRLVSERDALLMPVQGLEMDPLCSICAATSHNTLSGRPHLHQVVARDRNTQTTRTIRDNTAALHQLKSQPRTTKYMKKRGNSAQNKEVQQ